jgi:hypothetical protein
MGEGIAIVGPRVSVPFDLTAMLASGGSPGKLPRQEAQRLHTHQLT